MPSPVIYVCAMCYVLCGTGMFTCVTARNVNNDTNFDVILARAAHGTLEVKYLQILPLPLPFL
jgi:hypothetical protein